MHAIKWVQGEKTQGAEAEDYIQTSAKGAIMGGSLKSL